MGIFKNSRFFKFFSLYRKQLFVLFLLNLFSSAFFLAAPYFSKLFIDKAFINKDFAKFLHFSAWGAAIFIFSTLITTVRDIAKNRIAIKLKLNLADKFIKKFYSLDLEFFQSKSVGENTYRLSNLETIADFLLEQCPQILANIFKLIIILVISLWLNLRMTVFLLILSPLFLVHSIYIQKKLKPIYAEIWRYSANLSREIHEAFSRVLIIKAFGLEAYQKNAYLKSLIKNIRYRIKSFRWGIISSLTSSFLSKAIYGAITLYGGWMIIKGRLSIGSYTAVMIYLTEFGGLIESLSSRFQYFAQEIVSLERFFEIMGLEPQIKDAPGARILKSIKGEISFHNTWFGYRRESPIFKGLDFTIPAFSYVGIVGPSGCGKTTLVNLILRLYEPWDGEILLDGLNLEMISLKSLRDKVAIATQQPLLFDISIRENISYGLKGVGQAEIDEVGRIACLDDFIKGLPQGYDSIIGEDACRLSQGLKQRVAIARAILRKPQLLILDEATSSVDSLTEEKIFKNLSQKRQGLATLIISHRLFSVRNADRIYFLRADGKIEEGTHTQLLSVSVSYQEFFQNQLELEAMKRR